MNGNHESQNKKRNQIMKNLNIQLKPTAGLLTPPFLACFAHLPKAQAFVPPPHEGHPNVSAAQGHEALFYLTTVGGGRFALFLFGPAVFQP
jgi:hypothetical protein